MRTLYLSLFFLVFSIKNSFSQNLQLSVYSEVSILTAGPGDEFFEKFGHSAIRVKDPVLKIDHVFNYGVFDFNQPDFYVNFAKGKLLYTLDVKPFDYFIKGYKNDRRWMKEQVLELNQQEKQEIFVFLRNNALPQNAEYLYDPYFDNCSTKLKDIVKKILGNRVRLNDPHSGEAYTFRELMNDELPWNTWGSFGINTALGSKLDRIVSPEEYMYLPDYIYSIFSDSQKAEENSTKQLVKKENILLNFQERQANASWHNPFTIFSLIMLIVVYVTYIDFKKSKRSKLIDFLLFFITGLLGVLVAFLWFFTDHSMTPNNFNFLWAFAPNIVVAFVLLKRNLSSWIQYYLKLNILLIIVIPFVWISGMQLFSLTLIPIFLMLLVRYIYLNRLLSLKE